MNLKTKNIMKNEKTLLYLDNGDTCLHDNFTLSEAKKRLKQEGYTFAYSGRKFNNYGIKVLVGINDNNTIKLPERRNNGLYRATLICI